MGNLLSTEYQVAIWSWTWARLKANRLNDVEERFGKKFTEWAIEERQKLVEAQGDDSDIPIYTGSLGEVISLLETSIETGRYYVHDQGMPANVWVINHPLEMKPSVTTVDTSGQTHEGQIEYIDDNNLQITFNGSFSGKAYLS